MGRKRVRIDSKFQLKKCAKRCHGDDDDRISQLPDDILLRILSLLSLKEASRTSILSSRWKNLWKHISCLDFDANSALAKIAECCKVCESGRLRKIERRKYVEWVNSVLKSHKTDTLEEFRVCFDLSQSDRKTINQWLEFSFARRVQRLELDLSAKYVNSGGPMGNYVFPEKFLSRSIGKAYTLRPLSDSSRIVHARTPFDFQSLKALSLKYVNVSGEAIEFFLRNCPLLEWLVVRGTNKISNLEVCGPSLVLKHLELECCYDLKSIKVSAPNLTSLFLQQPEGLLLENVPMLVEVSITCLCERDFRNLLPALSCCIFQLEILALVLRSPKEIIELSKFPELPKLKKLVVEYGPNHVESLMLLTPLLRSSPYLQELVLKSVSWSDSRSKRILQKAIEFPHHHLKVFEFCGYRGRPSDVELVKYILENCVVLEKIIIDPRNPMFSLAHLRRDLNVERTAKDLAMQQLEGEVPQHIELVILQV